MMLLQKFIDKVFTLTLKKTKEQNKSQYLTKHSSSLLVRLLHFFIALALIIWITTGIITWIQGKKNINTFFDTQQILFAKTLATMHFDPSINRLPKTKHIINYETPDQRGFEDDDVLAFAIFSLSGEVLLTDDDNGEEFPFYLPNTSVQGFQNLEVDDDDLWRIFFTYSQDGQRIIAVGQEIEYRDEMAWDILMGQLLPWLFSIPFLLIGLAWIIYRELTSLREITHSLANRTPDDIQAINVSDVASEIKPLIDALNALFLRTGQHLEQERAFVANAAHELRTPLTGLTLQAEVISMCHDDEKARNHATLQLVEGTKRCTRLIDQLLLLSRLENTSISKKSSINQVNIPWETLLTQSIKEFQGKIKEREILLSFTIYEQPISSGFPELWAIALRNIVDNAIRHSKEDTITNTSPKISISLYKNVLIVENTSSPISKEILTQLGQRFYRPAGQNTSGSGLGIAIVEHICTLHHTRFILENSRQGEHKNYLPDHVNLSLNGIIACILFEK